MKLMLTISATIFTLIGWPGVAEEVAPTMSQYLFSQQPGTNTDECGVTLLVSSYPSPEYASARLQAIAGTSGIYAGKSTWGLTISAGDVSYSKGKSTGLTPALLSHATFTGLNFSSDGRLGASAQSDGSIFLYGVGGSVTSAMITAFQMGESTISFTRAGSSTIRSYKVVKSPPSSVMEQFLACTEKLLRAK